MRRTPEDIEDELLVLGCQAEEEEALRRLIERWQARLQRLAWRLTGDAEAARDVAQESWLAIVRGLRRLDDPARFRSWACRIVNHKCADWTRKRALRRRTTEELRARSGQPQHEAPPDAGVADTTGDLVRLRRKLRELPEQQRAILSLHHLDGLGVREIGIALGIPAGTVKSRLFHARATLRRSLERKDP